MNPVSELNIFYVYNKNQTLKARALFMIILQFTFIITDFCTSTYNLFCTVLRESLNIMVLGIIGLYIIVRAGQDAI